jgi:hypothetical protein
VRPAELARCAAVGGNAGFDHYAAGRLPTDSRPCRSRQSQGAAWWLHIPPTSPVSRTCGKAGVERGRGRDGLGGSARRVVAGADQTGFVCEDHGLDSVAEAEFGEDVGDVCPYCRFAEEESGGNFGVGEATCDEC